MKNEIISRKPWSIRLLAALILSVMLPAAVLAAPLRYCIGQNGHRGIEFVHAKDCSHVNSHVKARLHGAELSVGTLLHLGSHCEDRQLLPAAAKRAACVLAAPVHQPVLKTLLWSHIKSDAKGQVTPPVFLSVLHFRHPDPRLVSLRTVVLLN